jgi:3-hydroxyisobutyrate dehydrogenase-like beta-hydroxyacid dehydrogenase
MASRQHSDKETKAVKVGFIGIGNMGGPMCRNIIKNTNHEVVVFDLDPAAVQRCTDLGASSGTSVADVAKNCDVVITSLPIPRIVEEVALGPNGITENAKPGTVYIDLSTNAPATARRLAEGAHAKGLGMLEAPVSGGVARATDGTIVIMVGGDAGTFEQQLPLLKSFSGEVIHVGDVGFGSVAKLINNMLAFCNSAAAAEALMMGKRAGIDMQKLDAVIRNASGDSSGYRNMATKALAGNFAATFALDLAHKDLRLAMELADEVGVPGLNAPQVLNLMRMARGMGLGGMDSTSIMRVYETTLDTEVRG